jgi:hypothetical protein
MKSAGHHNADAEHPESRGKSKLVLGVGLFALLLAALFLNKPAPAPESSPKPMVLELKDAHKVDGLFFAPDANKPFSGVVVEYYDDETLKSRSHINEGRLNGVSEGWHRNGQLQIRESYENGVAHGQRTKWLEDGIRESEGRIEQGRFAGVFRKWHPNGQLAQEVQMTNGLAHGEARSWHENGSLKAVVKLDQGEVLQQQFFDPESLPQKELTLQEKEQ